MATPIRRHRGTTPGTKSLALRSTTVDVYPDGVLEGATLRSIHAHARVHRIDAERALRAPGVRAAISMLGEGAGPWEVRYIGQEIAAVAATSAQAARDALHLIDVEYEVLPAAIRMDGARAEGAPPCTNWEARVLPASRSCRWSWPDHHNQHGPFFFFSHHPFRAAAALEAARLTHDHGLFERTWRTQGQCHTPLEPHAAVAEWTTSDRLTVHLSTQACADMATDIAERYGLSADAVTVLARHIGGAFGSKSDLTPEAIAAIDLARQAGARVRVDLERTEEFTVGGYRPGVEVRSAGYSATIGSDSRNLDHAFADGGVAIGSRWPASAGFRCPRWTRSCSTTTSSPTARRPSRSATGGPPPAGRSSGRSPGCASAWESTGPRCAGTTTPVPSTRGSSTGSTASRHGETASSFASRPALSDAASGCRMARRAIPCSRNAASRSAARLAV